MYNTEVTHFSSQSTGGCDQKTGTWPVNATSLYTCGEVVVKWSGGSPPYRLTLHDELGSTALGEHPFNELEYQWTVNYTEESVVAIMLADSKGAVVVSEPLEVQWSADTSCLASDTLASSVNNDSSLLNSSQPGSSLRSSWADSSPSFTNTLNPLIPFMLAIPVPESSPLNLFQIILGASLAILALIRLCLNRRRRARRSPFLVAIGGGEEDGADRGWVSKSWNAVRRGSESVMILASAEEGGRGTPELNRFGLL
ncbi:hypothetical protein BCR35DRAFT_331651 [Leucosporidium creatinivorum]|uniref:Uncharacterized protein n=1 Tax=Leucosporidium creatinivorum TaxID=106004 RepID=A0A1Y2FEI3_9BASI|nr:hypothetical protein BCR35DRAFT_331651 [Leucosporidium creatinivorum]